MRWLNGITDSMDMSLGKLMCIESVMPSSHLILCRPLLLLPPIPPSIRVFSNESTLRMRWPKYWSFSLSISLSNEHPGLVSFRMDCLDPLAVQGTRKSLLQHHSTKTSILRGSAFFTVQLSHPYMTTGKTIALTRWTFVDKVMSLGIYLEGELIEYVAVLCFTSSGTVNLFHGGCWSPVYTFYFFIDILIQFMHCFPDFLQSSSRFSFGFLSIFSIIVL